MSKSAETAYENEIEQMVSEDGTILLTLLKDSVVTGEEYVIGFSKAFPKSRITRFTEKCLQKQKVMCIM